MYQSNTTKLYYVCYCTKQHVSILIESSSGPSKKTDPYLKCSIMRCGIPKRFTFLMKLCINARVVMLLLHTRDTYF